MTAPAEWMGRARAAVRVIVDSAPHVAGVADAAPGRLPWFSRGDGPGGPS